MIENQQIITPAGNPKTTGIILIAGFVVALAAVITFSIFARDSGATIGALKSENGTENAAVTSTGTKRVLIKVDGMSCPTSCPSGIKAMLERTPGVVSAEASYWDKQAKVEFNSTETSQEKIVESIKDMGYRASVKE